MEAFPSRNCFDLGACKFNPCNIFIENLVFEFRLSVLDVDVVLHRSKNNKAIKKISVFREFLKEFRF